MGRFDKIKNLFKRKNKVKTIESPKSWFKQTKKGQIVVPKSKAMVEFEIRKKRKFRIHGLRTAKRVLATVLLVINFFISQATLLSAATSQPLFWLFFLNSFILLDYLWKTRKTPKLSELTQ